MAGWGHCSTCAYRFLYVTTADYIRKLDEHYEGEHPGVTVDRSDVPMVCVQCPHCRNRTFSSVTAESAHRMLDEHIEEQHADQLRREKIFWTGSDLKFLKGCRISPE